MEQFSANSSGFKDLLGSAKRKYTRNTKALSEVLKKVENLTAEHVTSKEENSELKDELAKVVAEKQTAGAKATTAEEAKIGALKEADEISVRFCGQLPVLCSLLVKDFKAFKAFV